MVKKFFEILYQSGRCGTVQVAGSTLGRQVAGMESVVDLRVRVQHDGTLTDENIREAVRSATDYVLGSVVDKFFVVPLVNDGFGRLVEKQDG